VKAQRVFGVGHFCRRPCIDRNQARAAAGGGKRCRDAAWRALRMRGVAGPLHTLMLRRCRRSSWRKDRHQSAAHFVENVRFRPGQSKPGHAQPPRQLREDPPVGFAIPGASTALLHPLHAAFAIREGAVLFREGCRRQDDVGEQSRSRSATFRCTTNRSSAFSARATSCWSGSVTPGLRRQDHRAESRRRVRRACMPSEVSPVLRGIAATPGAGEFLRTVRPPPFW
jgi:hypothetical protein